jgi:putative DNA primase/helicase
VAAVFHENARAPGNAPAARDPVPPFVEVPPLGDLRESSIAAVLNSPPPGSDDDLALRFVQATKQALWYSPGMGWMHFDGKVWLRDRRLFSMALAREFCRRAARDTPDTQDQVRIASAKTIAAIVRLAASDQRIVVMPSEWDADPMALNTTDGIVSLYNGLIAKHHHEQLVTRIASASPSDPAFCPRWLQFLDEVFEGDAAMIDFMRRSAGYWLTADRREQKLWFLHGSGANGKSVFVDIVRHIMGSYALNLPAEVLMETKSDRHPTERAQLQGVRLAVSSELPEGRTWNEPLVKSLTGDATLTARRMRGDFFEFDLKAKFVIVGNNKPQLRGFDPAMERRFLLVPFTATFSGDAADPGLLDRLKGEADGILAWMIGGAVDWWMTGLQVPPKVSRASADYMAEQDDVQQFIDERCTIDASNRGAKSLDLYRAHCLWKRTRNEPQPSHQTFSERMKLKGFSSRKSNGVMVWNGIALRDVAEPED